MRYQVIESVFNVHVYTIILEKGQIERVTARIG
jgi:hypothetical protein